MLVLTRLVGQRVIIDHRFILELIASDKESAYLKLIVPSGGHIDLDHTVWRPDGDGDGRFCCRLGTSDSVQIGAEIALLLVETRVHRARIGFRTPPGMAVYREEIYHPAEPARKPA